MRITQILLLVPKMCHLFLFAFDAWARNNFKSRLHSFWYRLKKELVIFYFYCLLSEILRAKQVCLENVVLKLSIMVISLNYCLPAQNCFTIYKHLVVVYKQAPICWSKYTTIFMFLMTLKVFSNFQWFQTQY